MIIPSTISSAWIGLVGALGGVAITGLIGLMTAILNHRWSATAALEQEETALRQARAELGRTAYARVLAAADNLMDGLDSDAVAGRLKGEEGRTVTLAAYQPEPVREMQIADNEARIVAGDAVFFQLQNLGEQLALYGYSLINQGIEADDTAYRQARDELYSGIRAEQASDLGR